MTAHPRAADPGSVRHLYVIGEGGASGLVKVGRAGNIPRRLREIQTGYPRDLHLLYSEMFAGDIEPDVHRLLDADRCRGEWFDFGDRDPVAGVVAAIDRIRASDPGTIARARKLRTTPEELAERTRLFMAAEPPTF